MHCYASTGTTLCYHASLGTILCYHASPSVALCCPASPSTALCYHILPCTTKYCLVLPYTTMHHQVLSCACSTKSWHCAHDHPPTCTGTDVHRHRRAQAPSALCPHSVSAVSQSFVACHPISHVNPLHVNPTSDPICESHCALLLLGSSYGCKTTHEALSHADPRFRSQRGLQKA